MCEVSRREFLAGGTAFLSLAAEAELLAGPIPPGMEDRAEPVEVMAEAAYALVTGDPKVLTGKIAYSQQLLTELGRTAQALPEA